MSSSLAVVNGAEQSAGVGGQVATKQPTPTVPKVTVLPLRNEAGELTGSVEILRPDEPDLGFFLAGRSEHCEQLRCELKRLADADTHLAMIGPAPVVADVARAFPKLTGLPAEHFYTWPGSWDEIPQWPPGLLYLDEAAWQGSLDDRRVLQLAALPGAPGPGVIDAGGRIGRDFAPERQQEDHHRQQAQRYRQNSPHQDRPFSVSRVRNCARVAARCARGA